MFYRLSSHRPAIRSRVSLPSLDALINFFERTGIMMSASCSRSRITMVLKASSVANRTMMNVSSVTNLAKMFPRSCMAL